MGLKKVLSQKCDLDEFVGPIYFHPVSSDIQSPCKNSCQVSQGWVAGQIFPLDQISFKTNSAGWVVAVARWAGGGGLVGK